MTTTLRSPQPSERIAVLDILRGIALLGMFLVHFSGYSSGGGALDNLYRRIVELFLDERFWAIFAMLFGAGFAIQLRRAEARGGSFLPSYLRRLGMLAVFGFLAHAVFGFNVLLSYAIWGIPLLLVRRWSPRALLVAVLVSAASWNLYTIAGVAYRVATRGEQGYVEERKAQGERIQTFLEANFAARKSPDYPTVFAAHLQHMRWFYVQPFTFLPFATFTLILLGLLAVRLGLFDEPERHRRLIVGLMAFGVLSWAATLWLYAHPPAPPGTPLLGSVILARIRSGLGLVRTVWLAFFYVGVVLLLTARNPAWLRRLSVFGWTGRMALTNYMVQIAVLELLFANYGLGISVTPLVGVAMACALFVVDAWISRWWLARFRYGPLEWLWRSVTYARWQSWRVASPAAAPLALETT